MTNTSHFSPALREALADRGAPGAQSNRKALRMSYATPFYYAAKALPYDSYASAQGHSPRQTKQRRRRIRLMLLPALRPHRRRTTVAAATSRSSR